MRGKITTGAGALLLGAPTVISQIRCFVAWFTDHRDGAFVEHSVLQLCSVRR